VKKMTPDRGADWGQRLVGNQEGEVGSAANVGRNVPQAEKPALISIKSLSACRDTGGKGSFAFVFNPVR
jgi:hypothetical protein